MKHQAFRPAAVMLGLLLLTVVPAKAGTVHFAEAVHAVPYERVGAADVRLRVGPQSGNSIPTQSGQTVAQAGQQQQTGTSSGSQSGTTNPTPASLPNGTETTTSADPTLSQSGGQIETVDLGDVTGTVCDCGEIPVPPDVPGGFPKWPFLGVPLICVSGICSGDEEKPPPTCIVNCEEERPPIPEPATLLLFGTGLLAIGAGARRRYSRRRAAGVPISVEEVL